MKRSPGFLSIAALLCLGLCGVLYRVARTADEPPPGPAGAASAVPPRGAAAPDPAQLAELRREVARLRAEVQSQDRSTATEPAVPAADDPAAPAASETPAERQRRYRAYVAGVEAAFRGEPTSASWSSATVAAIQAALAGDADLGALARGVECRSSLCRVELAEDGAGKLEKALTLFVHVLGDRLPNVVTDRVEGAGGAGGLVLYMSRQDLPATP